ncbi:MAG: bifunctional diguanylate cyclase/phosphodiesterase, partial [Hyphomicrobiales bacterium]
TGLANRTRFHDALAEQVARQAETHLPFTLLMLDLDGFKAVNDSLGHSGGDDVLRIAADRLRAAVDERHLVARLGGDEFAILMRDSADPLQAGEIGRRVIASLEMPIRVQQQMVHVSASIGVMPSRWPPLSAGDMLTAADLALYDAKANGRATVRLFTPELRRVSMARSGLANDLQAAWTENQFELYYQPQVDLVSGDVLGAEALIRWNHAKTGLVAPGAFLPVLESSHLAVPVGDWILQTACRQARSFRAAGLGDVRIGINLFAAQLRSPDFVERVEEALRASGLAASQLELEITENIVLLNERLIADHLRRIRAMGIGIAFDDFGTGYASLTMLKKLDITRLKIDRSFISEIETSRKDQGIVDAVIRMAEGCDLSVIAEGIEKQSQADFLRGKVGEGQGYLFGKPKPADRFVQTFGQAPLSPERAMTPEQGVRKRAG